MVNPLLRLLRAAETPVGGAHTVLLVTAHPDDETLFFLPTLQGLRAAGAKVTMLCLSTGNSNRLPFFGALHVSSCASSLRPCRQRGGVGRSKERGTQSRLPGPKRVRTTAPAPDLQYVQQGRRMTYVYQVEADDVEVVDRPELQVGLVE